MSEFFWGIGAMFVPVGFVCSLLGMFGRLERGSEIWWACCALADFSLMIGALLGGPEWEVPVWAIFGASAVWNWWDHHRKNRDKRKVREALGAKSKALRDALVRRAREVLKPRPVLKPVPQGAA